jgi:cytochrome c553
MASRTRVFRIAGFLAAGVAGVILLVFIVAWSGVYSVAASRGHWAIVEWFLAFGMRRSVATHAIGIETPSLDDPDLIRLGAAHFHGSCAFCHGAPGTPINPVANHMLPPPPELTKAAGDWTAAQLFWIVKHGIKYTGMPSWVTLERDDEVWAVVAFLEKLPALDAAAYRELALGPVEVPERSGREIATVGSSYAAAAACARCHGASQRGPMSSLVPVLHGQTAEYLALALRSYAAGVRKSGIMQPVASELDPDDIAAVAAYYARLPPPAARQPKPEAEKIEQGRILATEGLPAAGVPPCVVCHVNPQALATYPRLAGQHADYMIAQLRLWKRGLKPATANAAVMAPIAQRLTEQQIEAVSAFFASLSPAPPAATQQQQ